MHKLQSVLGYILGVSARFQSNTFDNNVAYKRTVLGCYAVYSAVVLVLLSSLVLSCWLEAHNKCYLRFVLTNPRGCSDDYHHLSVSPSGHLFVKLCDYVTEAAPVDDTEIKSAATLNVAARCMHMP